MTDVSNIRSGTKLSEVDADGDTDWNEQVTSEIGPHPDRLQDHRTIKGFYVTYVRFKGDVR